MLIMDKRGQGLSTSTIVLIIIGVVVLLILILGFSQGWESFSTFIGGDNVDKVSSACQSACATGSVYSYCSAGRDLKDDEGNEIQTSCYVLSEIDVFDKYNIPSCDLDCEENILCGDVSLVINTETILSFEMIAADEELPEGAFGLGATDCYLPAETSFGLK